MQTIKSPRTFRVGGLNPDPIRGIVGLSEGCLIKRDKTERGSDAISFTYYCFSVNSLSQSNSHQIPIGETTVAGNPCRKQPGPTPTRPNPVVRAVINTHQSTMTEILILVKRPSIDRTWQVAPYPIKDRAHAERILAWLKAQMNIEGKVIEIAP